VLRYAEVVVSRTPPNAASQQHQQNQ
jgi:hypothetical protein